MVYFFKQCIKTPVIFWDKASHIIFILVGVQNRIMLTFEKNSNFWSKMITVIIQEEMHNTNQKC